jgi:hypothetical protein
MMENGNKNNGEFPLMAIAVVIALYAGYRIVEEIADAIELLLQGLIIIGLSAGGVLVAFWIYQYLSDKHLAKSRPIAKYRKLELVNREQKKYFKSKKQDHMSELADANFNDEARKIYDKKDRLVEAATFVKKVKDIFK